MDLEKQSIELLKIASEMALRFYGLPLVCTYSGGKDSDVMLYLFQAAGIPYEVHHSHTTIDAPQTIYHIREKFRELELRGIKCTIEMPKFHGVRTTMWNLIPIKMIPPTRKIRWCCSILKEGSCRNRMIATGVRKEESRQRADRGQIEYIANKKKDKIILSEYQLKNEIYTPDYIQQELFKTNDEIIMLMNDNNVKRRFLEKCELKAKTVCNPILEWQGKQIWEYIQAEKIKTNPLYECGLSRIGCVGCPMAGKHRAYEFELFPTYKRAYINAFDNMVKAIHAKGGETTWKNGQDVFEWYMEFNNIEGQMELNI